MSDEPVELSMVRPLRGSVDKDASGRHTAGTDRQRHGPTADGDAGDATDDTRARRTSAASRPVRQRRGSRERRAARARALSFQEDVPHRQGRIRYTFFVDT